MRVTNESLLIGAAIFFVAFGTLVTVLEHVRHPPARPLINFAGIAGVYLGLCAVTEHVAWLYVPCWILMLAATVGQFRSSRAARRPGDDDRPVGGIS